MRLTWAFGLLALLSCQKAPAQLPDVATLTSDASPPPDATVAAGARAEAVAEARAEAYVCASDAECVANCALGAISLRWWRKNRASYSDTCEDGCASKGLVPRCSKGKCTTVKTGDGKERLLGDCTEKPIPPGDPDLPYRCQNNADCTLSCAGALNAEWYRIHHPHLSECKDGCATKGVGPVQCLGGLCTARTPTCTRHPIEWTE